MDWGVTIHFSIEIQLVLAIREQERGERVIESSVAQRGQWSGHTERQKCSHRPNPQLLIASLYCKGSYFFPPEWRIADQYHYSTLCKYAYALQTGPEKHMVADLNALLLKDYILCIVYRFCICSSLSTMCVCKYRYNTVSHNAMCATCPFQVWHINWFSFHCLFTHYLTGLENVYNKAAVCCFVFFVFGAPYRWV